MPLNREHCRNLLREFDLKELFVGQLGWDHYSAALEVQVDGSSYALKAVAQKRGMVAFECPASNGSVPDYATRRKIETHVAKSVHEHLIIYTDATKSMQVWQWVKREPGKPSQCRDHSYYSSQSGESLIQKLEHLVFSLDEEDILSIVDVHIRVQRGLYAEKVTKRFYDRFKDEHAAFLKFVKGIPDEGMQRWYVSVTLNRLMFIYFLQKKGFLDADVDYLRRKLEESKRRGRDRFYRDFLCPLFFEGFAKRESDRSPAMNRLLGKVPYLNGGIFMRHQIEEAHGQAIAIADAAFERIFGFFDDYRWHLDERPLRNDQEINPDVLGYVFEKYINQKQMGAYYSKEDITGYISHSTVIPYLFDVARRECRVAFEGESSVWRLLRDNPNRYIYEAVRRGVIDMNGEVIPESALPEFVQVGMHDPKSRMFDRRYNLGEAIIPDAEGNNLALPTETWREYVSRRQRCLELRAKLAAGDIREINDLITYNLDIRQFAQDVIEGAETPDQLLAFWRAIAGRLPQQSNERVRPGMAILDPTCGSGAFLFAALNILEPLYEACLERMAAFLADLDASQQKRRPRWASEFRAILQREGEHPNPRYFILKSIILNNLFGVDIMEEAVEICKLRLFLKLVAQVDSVEKMEPLPDIDFNIQAGNTLVGYATYDDVRRAVSSKLDFEGATQRIEEKAQDVAHLFARFRQQQTELGGEVTAADKAALRARLRPLEDELNQYLSSEYGVDVGANGNSPAYKKWLASHKPFHWFIEFYGIMKRGGFDVIIGNPPYVQVSRISEYRVQGYATDGCPDIYALCVERSLQLLAHGGWFSMILPISFQFSMEFEAARQACKRNLSDIWVTAFSRNPAALFTAGLGVRNTICVGHSGGTGGTRLMSSKLNRWVEEYRPMLFHAISYTALPPALEDFGWPRLYGPGLAELFQRLIQASGGRRLGSSAVGGEHELRFKTTALYYISAFVTDPPSFDDCGLPIEHTDIAALRFQDPNARDLALAVALGKVALLWWAATGDDFHATGGGLGRTPIDASTLPTQFREKLASLSQQMKAAMAKNIIYTRYAGKWMGNYDIKYIRELTDQADRLVLEAYGLQSYWDDIELAYAGFMKATGERPGTTRELPDFAV